MAAFYSLHFGYRLRECAQDRVVELVPGLHT